MSRRPAMPTTVANQYGAAYDAEVARRPARIRWRKNTRGILVAVSVQDPLAEPGYTRGRARELGVEKDPAVELNRIAVREQMIRDIPRLREAVIEAMSDRNLADAARRDI